MRVSQKSLSVPASAKTVENRALARPTLYDVIKKFPDGGRPEALGFIRSGGREHLVVGSWEPGKAHNGTVIIDLDAKKPMLTTSSSPAEQRGTFEAPQGGKLYLPNGRRADGLLSTDSPRKAIHLVDGFDNSALTPSGTKAIDRGTVYDTRTGKTIRKLPHDEDIGGTPNITIPLAGGKRVATAFDQNGARYPRYILISDTSSFKQVGRIRHEDDISALTDTPDGKYVVSATYDGDVQVTRTADWKVHLKAQQSRLGGGSGPLVANGSTDLDSFADRVVDRMRSTVISLATSPDSRLVASGSSNRTVVRDLNTKKAILDVGSGAKELFFSPDSRYLIALDLDVVRAFDLRTGKKTWSQPLEKGINTPGGSQSAGLSPSGKYLAIIEGDDAVRVYRFGTNGGSAATRTPRAA